MLATTPYLATYLFPDLKGLWGYVNLEEIAKGLNDLLGMKEDSPNPFLNPYYCEKWKNFLFNLKGIDYGYGGWMEDRSVVWRGHYHTPGQTLHVGVDFYVPVNTVVHLPVKAKLLHAFKDPDNNGGWGGMQIFQWSRGYFLLAHGKDIADEIGKEYNFGDPVMTVAEPELNGNWSPHLHIQCMRQPWTEADGYMARYENIEGDFPDPLAQYWWLQ